MPYFFFLLLAFIYSSLTVAAEEKSVGMTAITRENYAHFLNAVAAQEDVHHLYNEKMDAGCSCSSILKIVVDSQWKYELAEHQEAFLEDSISWMDAARYCNWLENQLPVAMNDINCKRDSSLLTEQGVYELEGERLISFNNKASHIIQGGESIDRELHSSGLHFLLKNQTYNDAFGEEASGVEASITGLEEVEIFFEDAAALETLFLEAGWGVNKAIEANHSCMTPPRTSIRKGNASRTIKIPPIRKNLTRNQRDVIENPTYTGEEQGLKKAIATLFELKEGSLEKDNDHVSRAILLSQQALEAKEKVKIFETTRDSALEKAFPQLVAAKERAQQAEVDARKAYQQYLKEVQKIETKPQNSNIKTQLKKSAQACKQLADKKENENKRVLENKKDECLKSSDLHAVAPEWIQNEISGLTRIFHTDHLRKPGNQMDAALISKSSSGSVYTHSRRQTSSLALPHQPSRPPRHDQYEISGLINNASLKLVKDDQKSADESLNKASKQIAQARELDCGLDAQNQIATQVYQELKEKKGSLYQKIKEGEESDFCEVSFVEPNFSHKLYDSKKEFIGIPKSAEEAYQAFSLVLEEGLGAWKEVSAAADAAKHAWVQATKGIEDSKKKKRIWAEGVLALAKNGTGNYNLGKSTEQEAMALGTIFVGERAASSSKFYYDRYVTTLISYDGTRRFRSASWKPQSQEYKANFERGFFSGKDTTCKSTHDGHLLITDIPTTPIKK